MRRDADGPGQAYGPAVARDGRKVTVRRGERGGVAPPDRRGDLLLPGARQTRRPDADEINRAIDAFKHGDTQNAECVIISYR